MSKTQEELKQIKKEYELFNEKLKELTEDELKFVIGGNQYEYNIYTPESEEEAKKKFFGN